MSTHTSTERRERVNSNSIRRSEAISRKSSRASSTSGTRSTREIFSSILFLTILRKSSSWLISVSMRLALRWASVRLFSPRGVRLSCFFTSSMPPNMSVSGVRSSCEMLVKKRSLRSVMFCSTLASRRMRMTELAMRQATAAAASASSA